jgi:hypothetical protein
MHRHPVRGGGGISAIAYITLCAFLPRDPLSPFSSSLEFISLRRSNPNIGAHRLCDRENIHKMPPKKRHGKDFLVESSQATEGQVLKTTQTTTQPETSAEPRPATEKPEDPKNHRNNQKPRQSQPP